VVLDHGAGCGEEDALMTVFPADYIWRRAVCSVDLDNGAVTVLVTLMDSLDRQFVSDLRSHD